MNMTKCGSHGKSCLFRRGIPGVDNYQTCWQGVGITGASGLQRSRRLLKSEVRRDDEGKSFARFLHKRLGGLVPK